MIGWIKKLFPKSVQGGDLPITPDPPSFMVTGQGVPSELSKYIAEAFENDRKEREKALTEIKKLHPITQTIIEDLKEIEINDSFSHVFPPSLETRLLEKGKIIDGHIKKAIFTKKIEDIIND